MAERKYIKLRVDMYDDTKSKIIDMKPERDLIHYLWTRFIALAGKVNLEGSLFMSKTIPYTIETLAIEFNRGAYQVKLALDVFMELEMIECAEDNVYRVKNFAKHQNIKVKETIEAKDKADNINIEEVKIKENSVNKVYDGKEEELKIKSKDNEGDYLRVENKDIDEISDTDLDKIENMDKSKTSDIDINYVDNNAAICNEESNDNLQANMPIVLDGKKNKKASRSKSRKKNTTNINDVSSIDENDEETHQFDGIDRNDGIYEFDKIDMDEGNEENSLIQFYNGEEARPLAEGESVVKGWSFQCG